MIKRLRPRNLAALALAATALNPGELASQLITDAESMEACEVLRLGDGLDVPEWLAFVSAPSLMPDASGRVHVRAGQVAAITVLDRDGGFVRTIGGQGEGPGEFVAIGAMGFLAGDTPWLQNWPMLHTSLLRLRGSPSQDRGRSRGCSSTGQPQHCRANIASARRGTRVLHIPAAGEPRPGKSALCR